MNSKPFTCVTLGLLLVFNIVPQSAFALEKADVQAAVELFFQNLSDKTIDKAAAVCDMPAAIVDEFPPHFWYGPTACADWWKALRTYNKESGITGDSATLGDPWSVDVTADRAYYVAPATYTYNQHGKVVTEAHAVFTVALRRTEAGWRITSWTWSKH